MSGPVRNTFSSSLFTHSHTIAQAITHYEQAADYYKGEDSTGLVIILWMVVQIPISILICVCRSANKCLLKVAHMAAMLQQFDKAAGIFEEVFVISRVHTHISLSVRNLRMCDMSLLLKTPLPTLTLTLTHSLYLFVCASFLPPPLNNSLVGVWNGIYHLLSRCTYPYLTQIQHPPLATCLSTIWHFL